MKQSQTLSIDELCVKTNRDISSIFHLAKSQKLPLWLSFEGIDCYEEQSDGTIEIVSSDSEQVVMPAPEVIDTFLKVQHKQSGLLSIDERFDQEKVITSTHKNPIFRDKDHSQTVDLDTTPYLVLSEDKTQRQLMYNAFPALTTSGTPCILKQTIKFIEREWDDDGNELKGNLRFYSNYPIKVEHKDLFAYEDDANEYLRALVNDYCVGRGNLKDIFACKSFNTVVTWVGEAGFEFERLNEGDPKSRPMLKYSDIRKVKKYMRSKKNN